MKPRVGAHCSRSRNSAAPRMVRRGMTLVKRPPHGAWQTAAPCAKACPRRITPLRHAPRARAARSVGWLRAGATSCAARCRVCCTAWRWRCSAARCSGSRATSSGCSRRVLRLPAGGAGAGHRAVCGEPRAAKRRARAARHRAGRLAPARQPPRRVRRAAGLAAGTGWVMTSAALITGLAPAPVRNRSSSCAWWCWPTRATCSRSGSRSAACSWRRYSRSSVVAIPLLLDREVGVLAWSFTSCAW